MITRVSRPLNDKENQRLKRQLADVRKQYRRDLPGIVSACIVGWSVFFIIKFQSITKDYGVIVVVVLVLLTIVGLITFHLTKRYRFHSARLESALQVNTAQETRVTSTRVIDFEEIEDEGACYAFQLEHRKILFICGQEFYSTRSFPSNDFALVSISDVRGNLVDFTIINHGERLKPIRTVSAQVKPHMFFVDNLAIVDGVLDDLDTILGQFGTKEEHVARLRAAKRLAQKKH